MTLSKLKLEPKYNCCHTLSDSPDVEASVLKARRTTMRGHDTRTAAQRARFMSIEHSDHLDRHARERIHEQSSANSVVETSRCALNADFRGPGCWKSSVP